MKFCSTTDTSVQQVFQSSISKSVLPYSLLPFKEYLNTQGSISKIATENSI